MPAESTKYIETTVYELMQGNAGEGGGKEGPDLVAQIEHGFKFGRPVVSFGPIPHDLYARLDELGEDAAGAPYEAQTGADVDDLRYLWRQLGWAKEAGEASRRSVLTWNDGADTVSDTELEEMREVLERHYAKRLPALIPPTAPAPATT